MLLLFFQLTKFTNGSFIGNTQSITMNVFNDIIVNNIIHLSFIKFSCHLIFLWNMESITMIMLHTRLSTIISYHRAWTRAKRRTRFCHAAVSLTIKVKSNMDFIFILREFDICFRYMVVINLQL